MIYTKRVDVYWNLRRPGFYSIRDHATSKVIDYRRNVALADCTFTVRDAARRRIVAGDAKSVHAWITGLLLPYDAQEIGVAITYNPKRDLCFVRRDTREAVRYARRVNCLSIDDRPVVLVESMWSN